MTEAIELNWGPKTYVAGIGCRVAPVEDGFLIASVERPRFCFHAETEELAIAQVERAIAFWKSARETKP
jgi:hypothetical protein